MLDDAGRPRSVIRDAVGGRKALKLADRLEAPHLALSLVGRKHSSSPVDIIAITGSGPSRPATEVGLDLSGLTARVFHLGTLHTRGDAFVYVEEDGVLFAGDVIMEGLFPSLDGDGDSIQRWQAALDTLEALNPIVIIGAHGTFGDVTMIESGRRLFRTLLSEVRTLKAQGMSETDAAAALTRDFSTKYPQWPSDARRMNAAVRVAWRELP